MSEDFETYYNKVVKIGKVKYGLEEDFFYSQEEEIKKYWEDKAFRPPSLVVERLFNKIY